MSNWNRCHWLEGGYGWQKDDYSIFDYELHIRKLVWKDMTDEQKDELGLKLKLYEDLLREQLRVSPYKIPEFTHIVMPIIRKAFLKTTK